MTILERVIRAGAITSTLAVMTALAAEGPSAWAADLVIRDVTLIDGTGNEPVTGALLLNSHTTYDWFYPYLRNDYSFFMLDDYAPASDSVERRTTTLLNNIATQTDVLWIYDADAATTTPSEEVLTAWLNNRPPAHIQDIDGGRLYLFILSQ